MAYNYVYDKGIRAGLIENISNKIIEAIRATIIQGVIGNEDVSFLISTDFRETVLTLEKGIKGVLADLKIKISFDYFKNF